MQNSDIQYIVKFKTELLFNISYYEKIQHQYAYKLLTYLST